MRNVPRRQGSDDSRPARCGPPQGEQVLNSRVEQPKTSGSAADVVKYVVALLLAAGGLAVFYMVPEWHVALRGTAVVVGLAAGAFVFMTTAKGADTREFLYESRFELRKVIWPTRQETFRTTWIVMIVVALASLVLAAFDWVISWLVKLALGT